MTSPVIPAPAGTQGCRIAIVGAPGTGKTELAADIAAHLQSLGLRDIAIDDAPAPVPGRRYKATLLMGLDLPCDPATARAREHADALLRAQLQGAGVAYQVVYGTGPQRLQSALRAMQTAGVLPAVAVDREEGRPRAWTWACEKCSDPECEHRLFTKLREARG